MMPRVLAQVLLCCALLGSQQVLAHAGTHQQLEEVNRKIATAPQNQYLIIQRGIIYSHAGQVDLAIADFTRAAALGDPVLVAHEMGVAYYRKGDFVQSQRYFETYLQRFPQHAPSYEYRARVYRDMGELALAVANMQRYFELEDQPNPGNYIAAAEVLLALDQDSADPALAMLDSGMARLGLVPQLQRLAIDIEKQRAHYAAAIDRLASLEQALGGSVNWQVDMAELLILDGRYQQAEDYLAVSRRQLSSLRKTPARLQLGERIERLDIQLATVAY